MTSQDKKLAQGDEMDVDKLDEPGNTQLWPRHKADSYKPNALGNTQLRFTALLNNSMKFLIAKTNADVNMLMMMRYCTWLQR